jgi:hypothetical protein
VGSSPAKRAILKRAPGKSLAFWVYKGRLAQLVRASVLHTEGQRFKSSTAHFFYYISRIIPGELFYPQPSGKITNNLFTLCDRGDTNIFIFTEGIQAQSYIPQSGKLELEILSN